MRLTIVVAFAVLAAGCSREPNTRSVDGGSSSTPRMVKVGWDPPEVPASRYQVFVDDRRVQEISTPVVDAACKCLVVSVPVPPGQHVVKVVAYSSEGQASVPATLTVP
jgi:hypothetical protein